MTGSIQRVAFAILLVTGGCGGDHMTGADPNAFARTASSVSAAVVQHERNMATATPDSCAGEMSRYGAQMRPMVDDMREMSGDMDRCMSQLGDPSSADMQATCSSMSAELEEHLAHGCSVSDVAAEASRHAQVMRQLADHDMQRAEIMEPMMGGGMMSGRCGH